MTGHREERFLIKIGAQDQGVSYAREVAAINRMGFFFNVQTPPLDVLCAMKLSAVLARQKGRDYYDAIFLLSKTRPNMEFLHARAGIKTVDELKSAVSNRLQTINLNQKKRDFIHLLFDESHADRILQFEKVLQRL